MKASDYIARYLEHRGVTHVFELVGGMITFLVDSLHQQTQIKIVSMHHEQGAGFAAEGYGRMRGTPGVAMATSGPGATNLLTAIGSCYFDSVPTVFITGQVNRHELRGSRPIRQLGFQETDIVSMAKPVTKAAWMVTDPADLPHFLEQAFDLAMSGRRGPVLIDIPMDVQRADIADLKRLNGVPMAGEGRKSTGLVEYCEQLEKDLAAAARPLILAGGGIGSAAAFPEFRAFVEMIGIPVVNSLMGVDVLPAGHPQRVGLIGSYGNRWANIAVSESDLILVLGSRLDIRQTGADTSAFKTGRKIYHVDCDAGELNNRVAGCETIVSDLKSFLRCAAANVHDKRLRAEWTHRIASLRNQWPDTAEQQVEGINPNELIRAVTQGSPMAAAFIVDVGQHQMWAAQSAQLLPHQRFLTSGGMGAMGFALPASIGAALATGKPVVVIAGDGGFQLNIQELQTIVRNQLPIKIVVMNNHCHGMVRQFQESYFKGRYQSTMWGYTAPNFTAVARAYGLAAKTANNSGEIEHALTEMWEHRDAPYMLEVVVSNAANAFPKMAFGRPMSEMEPLAKPLEMEGT